MNARWPVVLWSLLRREFWEGPGAFKWTPIVIFALTLFFVLFALALGSKFDNEMTYTLDAIRLFADSPIDQRRMVVSGSLFASSVIYFQLMVLILLFYLSSCLYDDRKDRSILFWKSLPVSDTLTVTSKILTACLLAPAIYLAAVIATQLALLIIASLFGLAAGINPFSAFWLPASLPKMWFVMAVGLIVQALWLLPIYAWLVFCSSWAPRVPILVAVTIPATIALVQHVWSLLSVFKLPDFNIGYIILKRLGTGIMPNSIEGRVVGTQSDISDFQFGEEVFMSLPNVLSYLARVEMWIGIGIALILLAGAVWFRGRATDS